MKAACLVPYEVCIEQHALKYLPRHRLFVFYFSVRKVPLLASYTIPHGYRLYKMLWAASGACHAVIHMFNSALRGPPQPAAVPATAALHLATPTPTHIPTPSPTPIATPTLTCIKKPPAALMLESLLIETPSANAELVCSLSARYRARSSATSPVAIGIIPW